MLFLTLAAKHRWMDYCTDRLVIFVRAVRCNPPIYAKITDSKGRPIESMHSRYTGHKGKVSPAQWCSSVQLLPVYVYMALTSAT